MAAEIVGTLVEIICNSLNSGRVPEDWKIANLKPWFKNGARQKAGNCRPVSLTSIIDKTLESIIKEEIVDHLGKLNIIKPGQHDSMKGKSFLTNLLEFFEDVTGRVDRGEPVNVVHLDFQKVFDNVLHRRLVHKVKAHGIGGSVLAWIEN